MNMLTMALPAAVCKTDAAGKQGLNRLTVMVQRKLQGLIVTSVYYNCF